MENRTDKNSYTILFAIAMVVIVGTMLAFTASSLAPKINENQRIEKQQNILYAMGINANSGTDAVLVPTSKAQELFSTYIKNQIVIENGKVSEDPNAYLIDVKKEQTNEKEGKPRKLPLFIGEKDGKTYYIAPIRGKGLWDAIWGYVAMDKNMVVQGVYFDHKGETPGLGAKIKDLPFMNEFIGEHLLNAEGQFEGIVVSKSNADPKNLDKVDNEVDAIAGATITGNGVTAMIKHDLALYKPYFDNLNK